MTPWTTDLSHSFKPVQQQQNNRDASSMNTRDSRRNDSPSMEGNAQKCDDAAAKPDHPSVRHGRRKIVALDLRALSIFSGIYGDDEKKSRRYYGPFRGRRGTFGAIEGGQWNTARDRLLRCSFSSQWTCLPWQFDKAPTNLWSHRNELTAHQV